MINTTEIKTPEAPTVEIQEQKVEAKPEEKPQEIQVEAKKIKQPCPSCKNTGTVILQGDPHVRCTWCHAVLD